MFLLPLNKQFSIAFFYGMISKKIGDVMNLYRILKNAHLSRKEINGEIKDLNLQEAVVSLKREEEFSSSSIVSLTQNGVLDTNDSLTVSKYKSNLKNLVSKVKQEKVMTDFRIIREDNIFPYDWKWRVNSKDTAREYARSNFAYQLRMLEAEKKRGSLKNDFPFEIPSKREDLLEEMGKLESTFGMIYEPVKYRSTKHFTVNTPLEYTRPYNQVDGDRLFTVIDTVDNFCNSGYGYSADYQDAYLDVTHEPLNISLDAIVLIREDRYSELNEDVKKQLQERRVVLYRGDEATAINMVLSEEGVLPYRPGGKYMEFDSELEDIMIHSMQKFCSHNHLDYAHNHGNFNGKGGHFSDLLDSYNQERKQFEKEFGQDMCSLLPEYKGLINDTFYQYPERIMRVIGLDKVERTLASYNEWAKDAEKESRHAYDRERSRITPGIHELFLEVFSMIRDSENEFFPEIRDDILTFFHSNIVEEQVSAAYRIRKYYWDKQRQVH